MPKALRGPLLALLGVALGAVPGGDVTAPSSGVDAARIPATARQYLPLVTDLTAQQCPELPPLWVVAQVEAESGWDPAAAGDGVAGLLQFDRFTWMAAGGAPWSGRTPRRGDAVLDPDAHLRIAVPWLCSTLRAVTGHLAESGKPATALDAMLVCHVAGCSRVTGSASGVPQAGEAGCDERCAALVRRYLDAVQGFVRQYAATPPETPPSTAARRSRATAAGDEPAPDRPGATTAPTRHSTRRAARPPRLDRRPDGLHPARSDRGPLRHRRDPARARGGVRGLRRLEGRPGDPLGRLLGPARLEPEERPPAGPGVRPVRDETGPVRRRRRARRRLAHRALVPRPRASRCRSST